MLKDFVLETCSAPGTTATVNLAGAPSGRNTFASKFSSGVNVYYFMDDGTQWEAGWGVFTAGTPNTLNRGTVLANSAGTTVKLNFAGSTRVYNSLPAARVPWLDQAGNLSLAGNGLFLGSMTVGTGGSFTASLSNPGWQKLPSGIIRQMGSGLVTISGSSASVGFGITFPSAVITVVACNGDSGITSTPANVVPASLSAFSVVTPGYASGSYRVNWIAEGY